MRRTFLLWLSAVILATFVLTGLLVYSQFSRSARERAEQMMHTRISDMLELLEHADSSLSWFGRANDTATKDRACALAEIIRLNPSILHDQETLQGICNRLGAVHLSISNEEGTIVAAVPKPLVGLNQSTVEDMRVLTSAEDAATQELDYLITTSDTEDQGRMNYGTARRLDAPGTVRIGVRTTFEEASREESSLDNPAFKLRFGTDGRIIIFRRGVCVSRGGLPIPQTELMALPARQMRNITVDGKSYYVYAMDGEGYRLVGVLSSQEVYALSLKAALTVLLNNLLFFVILFAAVFLLLHRIVLSGMANINETLRAITEGDLERRVNVNQTPEFTRLSNGINFMVESLRSVGEERQQNFKRGLDLARTLQSTVLPSKFPAFPDINRFDLYAASFQANDVGGDFYDYTMPDADHLHFLVAEVDATGFPAALYMMRALTIIRGLTKPGISPVDIVTRANRELCKDNQAGIRMAIFYGSLNINTGLLEFVNAGNLCSLIQSIGCDYQPMQGQSDSLLGDNEDTEFHTLHLQLEPQDRLFLFTESVLNVSNTNNTPFNEARLQQVLRDNAETVFDVLQLVRTSLRRHAEGSKIQNDIAMLCLEYRGDLGDKDILCFAAQEADFATEFLAQQMEEVLAAPIDIEEVQNNVRQVLATLPPLTQLRMELACTEAEVSVCLVYPLPEFNPLDHVDSPLTVTRTAYECIDLKENRFTLWKTLM